MMVKLPLRICEYCDNEFQPKRRDQVFCCGRCRFLKWRKDHQKNVYHYANAKTVSKELYFRSPIGGRLVPVADLDTQYKLELMYRISQGGRGGQRFIPATDGGISEIKRKLIIKCNDLIVEYKELDGCDFVVHCLECDRDIDTQCPDKVRGLAQKLKKEPRKKKAKELAATLPIETIAENLGVCTRTIRRDLGGK
jgi:hypothetical protein